MGIVADMKEREQAKRLLVLSRGAVWAFPSSSGPPVPADAPAWAARFAKDRESLAEAATVLLALGDRAAATELAANVWRLWVLARDDASGRAFLAQILDGPERVEPSRARALALYGDGLLAVRPERSAALPARPRGSMVCRDTKSKGQLQPVLRLRPADKPKRPLGAPGDAGLRSGRTESAGVRALNRRLAAERHFAECAELADANVTLAADDAHELDELSRRLGSET
jgi:hypothetical protein